MAATSSSRGTKRSYEESAEFDDFSSTAPAGMPSSGDMQSVLNSFGSDISKTMDLKRKRLEAFSQASIKCSNRKVEEIWKIHQEERGKLQDQYIKQLNTLVTQWEGDMQKTKESDEKLQNLLRQQQKLFQQQRVTQQQKLMSIKQLAEQFTKSTEKLDTCHQQQQVAMQADLRKEMALLQKKMLMDSQNQEISQVRKTLQTMLAQV
ncbi:synaptonemal complex protein 3-like [Sycon ciliatum]|uniref:synaptonemal complex protein 3-like n=1 Tax=Sycon ciliatum TaxID=27933 RepID=UPI0031F70DE2